MASQSAQKMRRMASPLSVGKATPPTGPIKATQVFGLAASGSSLTLQGYTDLQNQSSLKTKKSTSDRLHSGSPSLSREKKTGPDGFGLRKSRSFDAVTSNCYLNGEWPRADPLVAQAYFCPSNLTADRCTQTPQEWCSFRSKNSSKSEAIGRQISVSSGDSLKTIKACLTRSNREPFRQGVGGTFQSMSPMSPLISSQLGFSGIGLTLPSKPMAIPDLHRNRRLIHGSPEGLNTEIEKLAMTAIGSLKENNKSPPDGRCAPIARQLKMCSAVTQTPWFNLTTENIDSDSVTLMELEMVKDDYINKGKSSPELVRFASPQTLTDRLAPEGCEKICGKFKEFSLDGGDSKMEMKITSQSTATICHIPSESSAFNPPLVKNYLNQPTQMAKKYNPPNNEFKAV